MEPREAINFMRTEVEAWINPIAAQAVFVEAQVVEVSQVYTARIKRSGANDPDRSFYPCLAPYLPVVNDRVLCAQTATGLILMGAINRGSTADSHTGKLAALTGAQFLDSPTAVTPAMEANDGRLATTAWVAKRIVPYSSTFTTGQGGETTINATDVGMTKILAVTGTLLTNNTTIASRPNLYINTMIGSSFNWTAITANGTTASFTATFLIVGQ